MAAEDKENQSSNLIRKLKSRYDSIVGETPWLRAIGPVFSLIGIFVVIIANIPEDIFEPDDISYFWFIILGIFTFIYLLLVAAYANERLRKERQLRQVESGFHYDSRGTLWNGDEPNIAFRIATFKGILKGLNLSLETTNLKQPMIEAGEDAATDFGNNFPDIYHSDIRSKKGGSPWDELSLGQKLHEWAEYDSSTGWGILTTNVSDNKIMIEIVHFNRLYEGEGGQIYGHFITGYCKTVASNIIEGHNTGKFTNSKGVVISKGPIFDGRTVRLTLVPE